MLTHSSYVHLVMPMVTAIARRTATAAAAVSVKQHACHSDADADDKCTRE